MRTDHTAEQQNIRQPFLLGYSDDLARDRRVDTKHHNIEEEGQYVSPKTVGRDAQNRIARDLLVFLLASILWVVAIFLFLPWPQGASSSSHNSLETSTTMPSTGMQGEVNEHGVMKDTSRFHNVTSGARLVTCGNSTAEALAENCKYDTLLNAWVPARCLDREWIEEYQDDGSWAAFADKNLTQKLALEDMGMMEHYYTSIRDHVNHCAMLWRKQFWTLFEDRGAFDSVIVNSYHTEHCAEFLSNLMTMERTEPTLVKVGFSGCWIKEDDEL